MNLCNCWSSACFPRAAGVRHGEVPRYSADVGLGGMIRVDCPSIASFQAADSIRRNPWEPSIFTSLIKLPTLPACLCSVRGCSAAGREIVTFEEQRREGWRGHATRYWAGLAFSHGDIDDAHTWASTRGGIPREQQALVRHAGTPKYIPGIGIHGCQPGRWN